MRAAPLQVAQFLAGLPQFAGLSPLQIDLDFFPSQASLQSRALSSLALGGTISFSLSSLHVMSSHPRKGRLLSPLLNNN